jgi:hypothetical protein
LTRLAGTRARALGLVKGAREEAWQDHGCDLSIGEVYQGQYQGEGLKA